MKTLARVVVICLVFFIFYPTSVRSQPREIGGYTIVMGAGAEGPQVCLGNWEQPQSIAQTGSCDGQIVGISELAAISARQTVDELDRLLDTLTSIDQRLSVNNDEIKQLIQAATTSSTVVEKQDRKIGELLRQTITDKFDALPVKILGNEELTKLKEDLLKDVERLYSLPPSPLTK